MLMHDISTNALTCTYFTQYSTVHAQTLWNYCQCCGVGGSQEGQGTPNGRGQLEKSQEAESGRKSGREGGGRDFKA